MFFEWISLIFTHWNVTNKTHFEHSLCETATQISLRIDNTHRERSCRRCRRYRSAINHIFKWHQRENERPTDMEGSLFFVFCSRLASCMMSSCRKRNIHSKIYINIHILLRSNNCSPFSFDVVYMMVFSKIGTSITNWRIQVYYRQIDQNIYTQSHAKIQEYNIADKFRDCICFGFWIGHIEIVAIPLGTTSITLSSNSVEFIASNWCIDKLTNTHWPRFKIHFE